MIEVRSPVRPEEVRFDAQHVLFVEGGDDKAFDPTVLRSLLRDRIRLVPLGPSFHVASVARALHRFHPTYYFLVDRDHQNDEDVERSWREFPNPETDNLLIWRRREMENYFLDPAYLASSRYAIEGETDLSRRIERLAQERIYMDAANRAIISVREELKRNWIATFTNPAEFPSAEQARARLLGRSEFQDHVRHTTAVAAAAEIERRFDEYLAGMTGGCDPVSLGYGDWPETICGKPILAQVVQNAFQVADTAGRPLQGPAKRIALVRDLLGGPLDQQPNDFQELDRLITERLRDS